jgi:hypothetical protein
MTFSDVYDPCQVELYQQREVLWSSTTGYAPAEVFARVPTNSMMYNNRKLTSRLHHATYSSTRGDVFSDTRTYRMSSFPILLSNSIFRFHVQSEPTVSINR